MQEQWRTIQKATNYEVSNLGNVRNKTTKQVLKGRLSKSGYLQVCIKIDETQKFSNRYNHRLVAQYWLDNPEEKREVNHKDGIKTNNNIENLEWVTSSENQKHRHSIGIKQTSNRKVGKFTKDGILVAQYDSIIEASKTEGCARSSIDAVLQGRRYTLYNHVWKYLD